MLLAGCSANAVFFFDQTAVVTALPSIQRELGATAVQAQWVISAYLLPLAALMVAAGRLGDVLGARPVFMSGLALFGAGSLACALAPGPEALIAARIGQGVGAALSVPLSTAAVTAAFPAQRRGWAIGALATGGTSFLAVGPLLGGVLTDLASWRTVFYAVLPLVAAGLFFAHALPGRRPDAPRFTDWPGLVLLATSLTCLVVALLQSTTWAPVWTACLGVAAGLLGLGFLERERRCATPLVATRLLRSHALAAALTALTAIQFAVLAVTVFLPFYLQHVLDYRALIGGLLFLPAVLATPLFSPAVGRRADSLSPRPFVLVGLLVAAAGLALVGLAVESLHVLFVVLALLVFGLSRPLVITPSSSAAIESLPPDDHGLASGLVTSARQIGAVLGTAVVGAIVGPTDSPDFTDQLAIGMWVTAGIALAAWAIAAAWLRSPTERTEEPRCQCTHCSHCRFFA